MWGIHWGRFPMFFWCFSTQWCFNSLVETVFCTQQSSPITSFKILTNQRICKNYKDSQLTLLGGQTYWSSTFASHLFSHFKLQAGSRDQSAVGQLRPLTVKEMRSKMCGTKDSKSKFSWPHDQLAIWMRAVQFLVDRDHLPICQMRGSAWMWLFLQENQSHSHRFCWFNSSQLAEPNFFCWLNDHCRCWSQFDMLGKALHILLLTFQEFGP